MSAPLQDGAPVQHSKRELARGLAIAAAIAATVLVVAVLPAEYGIDPTGAGKALGLTALKAPAAAPASAPAPTAVVSTDPHAKKPDTIAFREVVPYRADTREFVLQPGQGIELKARMDKGAALIYSWKTKDGILLHHEFHGDPVNAKNDEYESYIKDDSVSESRGTLVAPFTGVHGWYWKNKGEAPVTVQLQASGFYSELFRP
jgi:hypothetical protein